jgi:hypothetical protein
VSDIESKGDIDDAAKWQEREHRLNGYEFHGAAKTLRVAGEGMAAVPGDQLSYSFKNVMLGRDSTAWEVIGTGSAAAPDCAVTRDDVVHVVTLNSTGGEIHTYRKSGAFTSEDLGGY